MINLASEDIQFMLEELTMPKHLRRTLLGVIGKRETRISDAMADELRETRWREQEKQIPAVYRDA